LPPQWGALNVDAKLWRVSEAIGRVVASSYWAMGGGLLACAAALVWVVTVGYRAGKRREEKISLVRADSARNNTWRRTPSLLSDVVEEVRDQREALWSSLSGVVDKAPGLSRRRSDSQQVSGAEPEDEDEEVAVEPYWASSTDSVVARSLRLHDEEAEGDGRRRARRGAGAWAAEVLQAGREVEDAVEDEERIEVLQEEIERVRREVAARTAERAGAPSPAPITAETAAAAAASEREGALTRWLMDECIIAEADAAHYAELLIDDGFDSLLSLSAMDDADWPSAVKKGHRRTIERQALASLRASL